MDALDQIRRLWAHAEWADVSLLNALRGSAGAPSAAWREYAHVVGAEEVWLARLERRTPLVPVWPDLEPDQIAALGDRVRDGYRSYLAEARAAELATSIPYVNSAGRQFRTPVADILLHVALHGQYHRGKVNLLLRGSAVDPCPVDYIAWVRGVPAATQAGVVHDVGRSHGR
jgi:uncharacterized damage-inducible protein DinB